MHRFYSKPRGRKEPRVTVVGQVNEDNELTVAVARCSSNDRFVRKTGRAIAEGRLRKGKHFRKIQLKDKLTSEMFIEKALEISEEIIDNPNLI